MDPKELLRQVALAAAVASGAVLLFPLPPQPCPATDARENQVAGPPFLARESQFVRIGPEVAGVQADEFHVVYSVRNGLACEHDVIGNNVTISIFELTDGRVLLFGAGYGDRMVECAEAFYGSAVDAYLVDEVVRHCLGLDAARFVFVVPHGHQDHVNPEFVHALNDLGHRMNELWVHVGDEDAVLNLPPEPDVWNEDDLQKIKTFGSFESRCEDAPDHPHTVSFESTIGTLFFSRREGHTPGAVDLVLRHASGDYVVLGSAPAGLAGATSCDTGIYTQAQEVWKAHGNVLFGR